MNNMKVLRASLQSTKGTLGAFGMENGGTLLGRPSGTIGRFAANSAVFRSMAEAHCATCTSELDPSSSGL